MVKYDLYILDKQNPENQRKLENWYQKLGLDNFNYSLQEIDEFTSKYFSEEEFRIDLYKNNIITNEEMLGKGKISIRYNEKNLRKVSLGIVLNKDLYFFDINNLIEYIKTSIKDETFFKKFCNKYDVYSYKRTTKGKTIPELKHKAINYLKENYQDFIDDKNINKYNNVLNFVISINLFSLNKEDNSKKINYKNFHEMAMFCSNYESKKNNKIKTKKKHIKGQLSYFN